MSQLQHFLAMGGYASYVWAAYGMAVTVLLANLMWARRQKKIIFHRLHKFHQRESHSNANQA